MPYASWTAIAIVVVVLIWMQHRHEKKMGTVLSEQEKLKDQLEEATEKVRLFEYCIQENTIREQYDLSEEKHPEMYTAEKLPTLGKGFKFGWNSNHKPKPEFAEQIELSRKLLVAEMAKLQEAYKECLEPGAYTEYTDENYWMWFKPNYEHPYYYVSWFVRTGKNDWDPPKMD
jgi:hypothetical protein